MQATFKLGRWFLLALTLLAGSQPGSASTITPSQPGATTSYTPTSGPVACGGGRTCITTLNLPSVVNLGAAGAASNTNPLTTNITGLRSALTAEFPGFSYAYGGDLSNLVFNITTYSAFNTGATGGAIFSLKFKTTSGVLPGNLHWVQWDTDNWNILGFDPGPGAPKGLGKPEDFIDTSTDSPFYDSINEKYATPPAFGDKPSRGEPTLATPVINWKAWLFLVSSPDTIGNIGTPVTITFYDGIEWGFKTTVTPLPAAWTMMLIGLGVLGLMLRSRASGTQLA